MTVISLVANDALAANTSLDSIQGVLACIANLSTQHMVKINVFCYHL